MKSLLMASAVLAVFLSTTSAHADWIDLKGEGVINGTIVEETPDFVVFKDNYGKKREILRSNILYMEKLAAPKRSAAKAASKPSAGGSSKPAFSFKPPERQSVSRETEGVLGWINAFDQSAREFIFFGADPAQMVKNIDTTKQPLEQFRPGQKVMGGVGLALAGVGILGVLIFGITLLIVAFEQGVIWGALFIFAGASNYFSGMLDPMIGAVVVGIPALLNLYFVVSRWEVTRKPVVMQLYFINVFIAGVLLITLAS